MPPTTKPETKVNKKGETLYLSPGGNSYTRLDPNRVTAQYTPVSGANAGVRMESLASGDKRPVSTITSEQARLQVANAQKQENKAPGNSINEAYSKLFNESQKTKADLAEAQAKLTQAESGLSIADQQKKQIEDEAAAALLKGKKNSSGVTDPNAPAETGTNLEQLAGDSVAAKALMDSAMEQRNSITKQLDVLNKQMLDAGDDTKFMVRQIENLANQQIDRQQKANDAMVRGVKVAGLSAGIAQYSPETHSAIVQDTINEGLALIQDIEFKAMEKKYQAKKDLRDFNYKGYLESQKLITEYNDLKNQTIIKMYEQLQKEETNARERIKFDNEQADRNALIIAPELIGATPDEIAQAATANNIELGALMRAVNDAKYEQQSRELELTQKRESILSSRDARNRANKEDVPEPEKPMSFADIKALGEEYPAFKGQIPSSWTRGQFNAFVDSFPGIDKATSDDVQIALNRVKSFASTGEDRPRTTDEVVSDVNSRLKSDIGWVSAGGGTAKKLSEKEGDASTWKPGAIDAKNWLNKKATQDRIKKLADEGKEAYEIMEILKAEAK